MRRDGWGKMEKQLYVSTVSKWKGKASCQEVGSKNEKIVIHQHHSLLAVHGVVSIFFCTLLFIFQLNNVNVARLESLFLSLSLFSLSSSFTLNIRSYSPCIMLILMLNPQYAHHHLLLVSGELDEIRKAAFLTFCVCYYVRNRERA